MISNTTVIPVFYELAPVVHAQVANLAWEDWDLSASIPAGAKTVEILCRSGGAAAVGARTVGSALNRYITVATDVSFFMAWTVVPVGRVIRTYGLTNASFQLVGYWL